jgi:S1-C subfamily serine protease
MLLESISDSDREAAKAPATGTALRVKHVGKYGPHAVADKAGVKVGDILVAYDGKSDFDREGDIFWYVVSQKRVGDQVTFKVLRDGKPQEFTIPLQP